MGLGVVFFQLLADRVPEEDDSVIGIFQIKDDDNWSLEEVQRRVEEDEPPWYVVMGRFPDTVPWLKTMLRKERMKRPRAPQLMRDEKWFGAAEETLQLDQLR